MLHSKAVDLMDPAEVLAGAAMRAGERAASLGTGHSGSAAFENADGTWTVVGPQAGDATLATHVGDTTPPPVPTGVAATSVDGTVAVTWDGTLDGDVPPDFLRVNLYVGGVWFAALTEAGSALTPPQAVGTTVEVTATSEDDACRWDGTPAHNVSAHCAPVSVEVRDLFAEGRAEMDAAKADLAAAKAEAEGAAKAAAEAKERADAASEAADGLRQTVPTKVEVSAAIDEAKGEVLSSVAAGYVDKATGATLATKSEVSQTADAIRSEVEQNYVDKATGETLATKSEVEQTAASIRQEVARDYVDKATGETLATKSELAQTADGIRLTAESALSKADAALPAADAEAAYATKASLEVTADAIRGEVQRDYVDKATGATLASKSLVEQTADQIKQHVGENYVDKATGQTLATKTELKQTTDAIKLTADSALAKIDGLEVGGEQLLTGTRDFTAMCAPKMGATTGDSTAHPGFKYIQIAKPSSSYVDPVNTGNLTNIPVPKKGDTYTLSFDAWSPNGPLRMFCYLYEGVNVTVRKTAVSSQGNTTTVADGQMHFDLDETYRRYWVTWTYEADATKQPAVLAGRLQATASTGTGTNIAMSRLKLERGNLATDWSPAPADADAKYSTKAELQVQTDRITGVVSEQAGLASRVSTVEQKSDSLTVTINKLQDPDNLWQVNQQSASSFGWSYRAGGANSTTLIFTEKTVQRDVIGSEWFQVTAGDRIRAQYWVKTDAKASATSGGTAAYASCGLMLHVAPSNGSATRWLSFGPVTATANPAWVKVDATVTVPSLSDTVVGGAARARLGMHVDGSYSFSGTVELTEVVVSRSTAAQQAAENAAKTATNFMELTSAGLVVGNRTDSAGLRGNTLISTTGVSVRSGTTELAKFSANEIELGKNDTTSKVKMCGGRAEVGMSGSTAMFSAKAGSESESAIAYLTCLRSSGATTSVGVQAVNQSSNSIAPHSVSLMLGGDAGWMFRSDGTLMARSVKGESASGANIYKELTGPQVDAWLGLAQPAGWQTLVDNSTWKVQYRKWGPLICLYVYKGYDTSTAWQYCPTYLPTGTRPMADMSIQATCTDNYGNNVAKGWVAANGQLGVKKFGATSTSTFFWVTYMVA